MPPKNVKGQQPKKAANGYKLPDPLPEGLIFSSTTARQTWRLGKSIGVGGFGEIYLCSEDTKRSVGDDAPLAVKIEPHENGPLFVEMNFYLRAAKPDMVNAFMKSRNIKELGMPVLRGNGSHTHKGEKYRFLVMDRFGKDLQKIFQNGKKLFSIRTAFNLAMKTIDVLEYIHAQGYVHNDIKAQNMLLGYGRTKENEVYLVDFGLVSKYQREGVHLQYKPDARKAHDGTIEYTSRDAHIGAHSRRSDLEILGYNLIHWMSGTLPWMDNLTNPQNVQAEKNKYMRDIPLFLQTCFGENEYPDELEDFLVYTASLEFDTQPDYEHCRSFFSGGLKKRKFSLDGKIDFSVAKSPAAKKARKGRPAPRHRERKPMMVPPSSSQPSPSCTESGAVTRSGEKDELDGWSWEQILCSDPEMLIRQASRNSETDDDSPLAIQHRLLEERREAESLVNPTPAMKAIIRRMEQREKERLEMTWQQQLQHLTGSNKNKGKATAMDLPPNPLTPAMEEVIRMRSNRISFDYDVPITPDPSDSDSDMSEDSDSSHEEYIPTSSSKKQPISAFKLPSVSTPMQNEEPSTSRQNQNGLSKRGSPARRSLLEDEVVCSTSNGIKATFDFDSDNNDDAFNLSSTCGLTFGAEDDSDDDEFEFNESIMKFLRDDGVSLAQQQQEFRRLNRKKTKNALLANSPEPSEEPKVTNGNPLDAPFFQPPMMKGKTVDFESPNLNFNPGGELGKKEKEPEPKRSTSPSFFAPLTTEKLKSTSRRISIQNDVSPIRNKDSPPEKKLNVKPLKQNKKSASNEKWIILKNDDEEAKEEHKSSSKKLKVKKKKSAPAENVTVEVLSEKSSPRKTRARSSRKSSPAPKSNDAEDEDVEVIIKKTVRVTRKGVKRPTPDTTSDTASEVSVKQTSSKRRKVGSSSKGRKVKVLGTVMEEEVKVDREEEDEEDDEVFLKEKVVKPSSVSAAMVRVAAFKNQKQKKKKSTVVQKSRRMKARCGDTQSWNWGEVLLSNPEKSIKSKRK